MVLEFKAGKMRKVATLLRLSALNVWDKRIIQNIFARFCNGPCNQNFTPQFLQPFFSLPNCRFMGRNSNYVDRIDKLLKEAL